MLAEFGETVHVISQQWAGAEKSVEETCSGRLIVHRVPFEHWKVLIRPKLSPRISSEIEKRLFYSQYYPQCFSWTASLYAEKLIREEEVDVVEAQEFEAPSYYLQLRREKRYGPKKLPPIILHLHSPTEFIRRHNDWSEGVPYQRANRFERYVIRSADALVCPSDSLAKQVAQYFQVRRTDICVIPYPHASQPVIKRSRDIWQNGSICYVGRLEKRKGVVEWIEAAVKVAEELPSTQFDFIGQNILGSDSLCGEEVVYRMIPASLRQRFHFYGEQPRHSLPSYLSKARIGVVPSRWENFPNTCIEAMSSGMPVLVSPNGGMKEMVQDGISGWIAPRMDVDNLAVTLRRALRTDPSGLERMGKEASSAIRRICDPEKIVHKHMALRKGAVRQGVKKRGQKSLIERTQTGNDHCEGNYDGNGNGLPPREKFSRSLYSQRITLRRLLSKIKMIGKG
ncbi:MAG: glycosyltransferase family 1 protein [Candidatus Electrothrix sp. MAN1_4]|nr:glycosyltransferase family 1 protein [Candidatus Electrothrix sp. MAN1_4]